MSDKILIIGKRSFIGMNLYNHLKFISKVKIISYTEFLKKKFFKSKIYNQLFNSKKLCKK